MLYQIINGRVSFAADTILDNFNFEIKNKNDKIAVIGRNGAGKSTLLKVITGEVQLEKVDGVTTTVSMPGNPTIGYLKQITFEDLSVTLDDEIRKVFVKIISMKERLSELTHLMEENSEKLSKVDADSDEGEELLEKAHSLAKEYTLLLDDFNDRGGYFYEKEYDVMLKSFGFDMEDKKKQLSQFSGGQLTKLAFIKLLLSKPDILLLDEPTNHLDINTISWLEQYLRDYKRAVVIVSHDRMFLDRIVNTVYEITYGIVNRYVGNYTDYVRIKKERYEKQMKDHIAQQKEIARLTELVERFKNKPSKVAMTRSKLKMIEHMELVQRPADYDTKSFQINYTPRLVTGNDVLFVQNLSIGYDSELSLVNLDIKRGERIGVIGDNGIGKSTLLKTLVSEIKPLAGDYRYGVNVEIGYFDQRMAQYTSEKTVLDDFWDEYPNLTMTEARNALGAFLFTQDEVYKDVSMLSGGERVRLALSKIFQKKPNVLILDEPTNHMDMIGKETLEAMLMNFPGTVIFVSHDRYFVKKVATRLLVMDENGSQMFNFGYEEYEEKYSPLVNISRNASDKKNVNKGTGGYNDSYGDVKSVDNADSTSNVKELGGSFKADGEDANLTKAQKSYKEGKEAEKIKRKIGKLEKEMQEIEEKIEALKEELAKPENASNYMKLSEIQAEIDENDERLLEIMEEWEELS